MKISSNDFVPWLDSSLLPEESAYSVLNKVSWFLAMPPINFLRACKSQEGKALSLSPRTFSFNKLNNWSQIILNERVAPSINGMSFINYITRIEEETNKEVPTNFRVEHLRVCKICITDGIHLRFNQHAAIAMCPLHECELQSECSKCGRKLTYGFEKSQVAYSCVNCGELLLNSNSIALSHKAKFKTMATKFVQQFEEWKNVSLLNANIKCGISNFDEVTEDINPLSANGILLTAACQSVKPPPWVKNIIPTGFKICFKRFDLCQDLGHSISCELSQQDIDAIQNSKHQKSAFMKSTSENSYGDFAHLTKDRFRASLRRVTSVFLTRYGHLHTNCLDAPFKMFGEKIPWDYYPEDILNCCPVAVGFWIWRIASTQWYEEFALHDYYIISRGRNANIDLLLYTLSRSHLHYCLYLANYCFNLSRTSESVTLQQVIYPIENILSNSNWLPIGYYDSSRFARKFDIDGISHCLNFDISEILHSIPCQGSNVYFARLHRRNDAMRRLRGESLFSESDRGTCSTAQMEHSKSYISMSNNCLFKPNILNDSDLSNPNPFLTPVNLKARMCEIIESSINSKI